MQAFRKDIGMHDYKTCDCAEKADRQQELLQKPRTEIEEAEFRFLTRDLLENTVLV